MCQHPKHEVNVPTKGVLCTPDSSKFVKTPCIYIYIFKSYAYEGSDRKCLPVTPPSTLSTRIGSTQIRKTPPLSGNTKLTFLDQI